MMTDQEIRVFLHRLYNKHYRDRRREDPERQLKFILHQRAYRQRYRAALAAKQRAYRERLRAADEARFRPAAAVLPALRDDVPGP